MSLFETLFTALRRYPEDGPATQATLDDLDNVLGQLNDTLDWLIEGVANLLATSTDPTDNEAAASDIARVSFVVSHMAELAMAIKPLLAEVTEDLAALDEDENDESSKD